MAASFDLLLEPWIGCVWKGRTQRLGILALLEQAHEIVEIVEPSPLVRFSIYRLLLAIVHWVAPVKDEEDWRQGWAAGRFSEKMVEDVRKRGKECFDLFHAKKPFYQVRSPQKPKRRPVADLMPEVPAATNINHFWHSYDGQVVICPGCAARGLVSLPAFCTQGGRSKPPSVNYAPPLYVIPTGENLFQTLMLNLPIREMDHKDKPAWEDAFRSPQAEKRPIGLLEGLTWQARTVKLDHYGFREGSCSICGEESKQLMCWIVFQGGRSRKKEASRPWEDPHVPTTKVKTKPESEHPPDAEKNVLGCAGFWRRAARAALPSNRIDDLCAPVLCCIKCRIGASGSRLGTLVGHSFAFYTRQNKFFDAQNWCWEIPPVLWLRDELGETLRRCLEFADSFVHQLLTALPKVDPASKRQQRDQRDAVVGYIQQSVWTMEGTLEERYRQLLADIATHPDEHGKLRDGWEQAVVKIVETTLRNIPRHWTSGNTVMGMLAAEELFKNKVRENVCQGGKL